MKWASYIIPFQTALNHQIGKKNHVRVRESGGSCLFIKPVTLWMHLSECSMGKTDYLHRKSFPQNA